MSSTEPDSDRAGSGTRAPGAVAGLPDHPLRPELVNEVHARPYELLEAPLQISHLAILSGRDSLDHERRLIAGLCRRHGVSPPAPDSDHFSTDLDLFRLKWERHTEFSTFTFIHRAPFETPFREPAIRRVPPDWLAELPGETLVAVHVALVERGRPEPGVEELAALFATSTVVGSRVAGGAAMAWTDFRTHADGFGRILVHDSDLTPARAGRLVQRLLEIETYRMMALLALPLARRHTPELARLDASLASLAEAMTEVQGLEDQQRLLAEITRLAAEVERIAATTNFRFSAAQAYYQIVVRRIEGLREQRVRGLQAFGEFMNRRLAPAMSTCESVHGRLQALSSRVARASDLLSTRVGISTEMHNRDLLASMDRRASLQIRLQQTVEGLSVVVLSYYGVGLVGYALKALKAAGVALDVELLTGLSIPVVLALVFAGVHRLRRMVARHESRSGSGDGP